jgi:hypothetical protein
VSNVQADAMVLTAMGVNGVPVSAPATLPVGHNAMLLMAGLRGLGAVVVLRRRKLRV